MTFLFTRFVVASVVAVALGGCLSLGGDRSEIAMYALVPETAPTATRASGAAVDWQLIVDVPFAPDPFDGAQIALSPRAGEFGIYAGVEWIEPGPQLVQSALVRAFEASQRIAAVAPSASAARADRVLETDLTAFHAEYRDGADTVTIDLTARLIDARSNRIVAARRFEARVPLAARNIDAVVAAFNQSSGQVFPEIVDWALDAE